MLKIKFVNKMPHRLRPNGGSKNMFIGFYAWPPVNEIYVLTLGLKCRLFVLLHELCHWVVVAILKLDKLGKINKGINRHFTIKMSRVDYLKFKDNWREDE